jgi:outer membrane autotransporter protein
VISGTGAVTKEGAGTLTLTGATTYSGGTTISAGTLQLGSGGTTGSIAGNIVNNGILAFNRSNDLLIAGNITGSGAVQQNGAGTTTLTGASTYTGATTINAGTLVVNGSIASNVTLAGGALKGIGSIGGLTMSAGSTVAPGNSIGTLTVTSVTFVAGSTYEAEVNAAGQSDLINASGSASLNGTVQVLAAAGTYAPVTSYRLINAAGGITGTFASVTSNQAGLLPSLIYTANAVDLKLTRSNVQFGTDYGVTPNQIATGNAVTAGGATSGLYNAVANAYAPATIGATLDGLSGEIHASLRGAMLENSRLIRGAVLGRLAQTGTGIWAQGFAESGDLESDSNTAETNRSQSGFIAGIDTLLGDDFRLGLAGAYSGNAVSATARSSRASGTSGAIIGYASWRSGPVALSLGGDIGWGDTSVTRAIAALGETAGSTRSGESSEVFAQASYDLDLHGVPLAPYFTLAHATAETGAFAETGGLAALSGAATSFGQTYSILGVRTRAPGFDLGGMAATPRFGIGWSHAFDAVTPTELLTFRGTGQSFTVSGASIGTDTAAVELGLDLAITPQVAVSLGYDGNFSGRSNSHAVRGGLDWRF